jgi:hypothetical protein
MRLDNSGLGADNLPQCSVDNLNESKKIKAINLSKTLNRYKKLDEKKTETDYMSVNSMFNDLDEDSDQEINK